MKIRFIVVSIIIILGTILSRKNFENLGKDREKFVEEIANEHDKKRSLYLILFISFLLL